MAPAYARRRPDEERADGLALAGLVERGERLAEQARRRLDVAGAQQLRALRSEPAVAGELGLAAQARLDVALRPRGSASSIAVDQPGQQRGDVVTPHEPRPPLLVQQRRAACAGPGAAAPWPPATEMPSSSAIASCEQAVHVLQHDDASAASAAARRARREIRSSASADSAAPRAGPRARSSAGSTTSSSGSACWRRRRLRTCVAAAFAVMRYIHVENCASPRKLADALSRLAGRRPAPRRVRPPRCR